MFVFILQTKSEKIFSSVFKSWLVTIILAYAQAIKIVLYQVFIPR